LRARLPDELRAAGRDGWVEEECAALAALAIAEKAADPDAYLKLKGAKDLDRRGLAVLRALFEAREALALELDRPPFMIVGHETLVALAAKPPRDRDEMLAVPGVSRRVVDRAGTAVLDAIARGQAVPEAELPAWRPAPRPHVPAAARRRAEALRAWRVSASKELGLDPGVLMPQRLIDRLAADHPRDAQALERVDGIRRWRAECCGAALLRALASA